MVEEFIKIFEGLDRAYGTFERIKDRTAIKIEGKNRVIRGKPSIELWQNHLDGKGPGLGIMPLKDDGTCKWGMIDIDLYDRDYTDIIQKIHKLKLPLIPIRSKSGGAHLFLFMKNFAQASEVQQVVKKFAAKLGVADKMDKLYPQQTTLQGQDCGSWLNMPYYNHEEGTRYAWKENGDAATLEEFFEMHKKYAQDDLGAYLAEDVKIVKKQKTKDKTPLLQDLLIPCIKGCLELNGKIPADIGRSDFLLHTMTFVKRAEKELKRTENFKNLDTAEAILKKINTPEYMEDPLPDKELENTVLKSSSKKDYKYLCKRPAIKKYCNALSCKFNIYGINEEEAKELKDARESFGTLTKYESHPPKYYESIDVQTSNGGTQRVTVIMSGEDLIDKNKYVNKLANMGYFLPLPVMKMKPSEFLEHQYVRLANMNYEQAPAAANKIENFKNIFYDFVESSLTSYREVDVKRGSVYIKKEKESSDTEAWFQFKNLRQYLKDKKEETDERNIALLLKQAFGSENADDCKEVNGYVKDEISKKRISCVHFKIKNLDMSRIQLPEERAIDVTNKKRIGSDEKN